MGGVKPEQFFIVPNVVTTGMGTDTKMFEKEPYAMVCVLHPVFCLYGATALAKKTLLFTRTQSTLSFYSM